jgi:hypothetical protein
MGTRPFHCRRGLRSSDGDFVVVVVVVVVMVGAAVGVRGGF